MRKCDTMEHATKSSPLSAGLLGEKLGHSYSPQIHRALVGDQYSYTLFERAPKDLGAFLQGDEWDCLNVTIPYKKAVMPYLSEISSEAQSIGAVNTITHLPDGGLRGDNTDYFGLDHMIRKSGVDVAGKVALVLGNGGAAATAVAVLRDRGARVVLLARSDVAVGGILPERFETVYERHPDAAVAVNCTPLGMYPRFVGESPIDPAKLPGLQAVFDMVYNPARTALMQAAAAQGIPVYNGLSMLVAQAARASEIFRGLPHDPDCETMIDRIVADMARRTANIVLVGMPGCGKSTIAARLADVLDRHLLDTDAMVIEADGRPIPTIFAEEGEEAFRLLETEAVRKAGMSSGAVIATGGGVVTQERNRAPLAQNGRIVFIERALDRLPTKGRPLSEAHPLADMYAKRLPLYRAFADVTVDNNGSIEETVRSILSTLGYAAP